jgi:hypothetical protein
MKPSIETNFAAFVGIDWADAKHDVCLQQAGCDRRERSVLAHRPEPIEHWALSLREPFAGRRSRYASTSWTRCPPYPAT